MTRRKRRFIVAGLVGVVTIVLVVIFWPGDKHRLQGSWVGEGVLLTVEGDLAILERPESSFSSKTYFRLDPWASPKRIVIWDADAPQRRPKRILGFAFGPPIENGPVPEGRGIYELSGDRLRICMPEPGGDFPTNFEEEAGRLLLDLRRQ